MVETTTNLTDICLIVLGIVMGWRIIVWLDRNVFNKNRYHWRKDKK